MALRSDKQLQQVSNILNTLIEATEHFKTLSKDKELNQSIFIFSSIVEGFEAINNSIDHTDKPRWKNHKSNLEKSLLLIAKQLEQANFLKINEIIQFSLLPNLNKMHNNILDEIGEQEQNKKVTIGVFASFNNPKDFYSKERLNAMLQESQKQNTELIFFTSRDVDFDKREISADIYKDDKWEKITTSFPDVVNNNSAGKRSHIDRKLRREIPFTSFYVGNKFTLPKRIVQYRKYAELLVPFKVCKNESEIHQFIEKYNKVVFKAISGNRGEDIYFVTKKNSRYLVLEHKKERIYNRSAFDNWLETIILAEKNSYIIQRYVHTRTKNDEPYHIRAHVQKNGNGEWVLTHIYPRVGNKKSNLSNVATDGRVEDLHTFMIDEYGDEGEKYEQDILRLSLELAHHLDKLHGLVLNELGIDLAIDETGRYWMHEANNGPQTAYHEEKRAVNTIAYAKYLAENGIMHTDKRINTIGQYFQSKYSKLPRVESGNSTLLGMLIGLEKPEELAIALNKFAKSSNITSFLFRPKDIDFDEMLIRGHFYEDEQWVEKIVEYPDVIFDCLKLRGNENIQMMYEELQDISFTNDFPGHLYSHSNLFNKLSELTEHPNLLLPYQQVTKTRDVTKFIENHGRIIMKFNKASLPSNGYYIEKDKMNGYIVTSPKSQKTYHELPFQNFIKEGMKENNFIIQKDPNGGNPIEECFEIHIHGMKINELDWDLTNNYVKYPFKDKEHTKEELKSFIENHYSEEALSIENNIFQISTNIVKEFENIISVNISEISIILTIDHDRRLRVLEINPNGPQTIHDVETTARNVVMYAKHLAAIQ